MKVLAYVNHFFGERTSFRGQSTTQSAERRRQIVEQTCAALRSLPAEVELAVCGIPGSTLLPPNVEFGSLPDPRLLVYASIAHQIERSDAYDYIINIEDDILLPAATWEAIVAFDREHAVDACLLPNRLESDEGGEYCVDLKALPGWTSRELTFGGHVLRVANNPHSGLAVLSRQKALYARAQVDLARREVIIGGLMASAYANLHGPFAMYRPFDDLRYAHVIHLDHWQALAQPPVLSVKPRQAPKHVPTVIVTRDNAFRVPAIIEKVRTVSPEILVWNNNVTTDLAVEHTKTVNATRDWGELTAYAAACHVAAPMMRLVDDSRIPDNLEAGFIETAPLLEAIAQAPATHASLRELRESTAVRFAERAKRVPLFRTMWRQLHPFLRKVR